MLNQPPNAHLMRMYEQIKYTGVRNICCGNLRCIGKTTTLIHIANDYAEKNRDKVCVYLVHDNNPDMIVRFKGVLNEHISVVGDDDMLQFILDHEDYHIVIFADEVELAERHCINNVRLEVGFYSFTTESKIAEKYEDLVKNEVHSYHKMIGIFKKMRK